MRQEQIFFAVTAFVITQRLWELNLARKNTNLLFARGGVEFGREHYWLIVGLHSFFFLSLITEAVLKGISYSSFVSFFFFVFLLAQVGRVWVIYSLGNRWTTRIIVLPGETLVRRGPYKFFPHPNYFVVALELAFFPLAFGLPATAIFFSIMNALVLLRLRIPAENKALVWAQAQ